MPTCSACGAADLPTARCATCRDRLCADCANVVAPQGHACGPECTPLACAGVAMRRLCRSCLDAEEYVQCSSGSSAGELDGWVVPLHGKAQPRKRKVRARRPRGKKCGTKSRR